MRVIEQNMLQAIARRENWKSGNTSVSVEAFGSLAPCIVVRLHGNTIYVENAYTREARFTLAGWNTSTTRSRLRAFGVDVRQKNWGAYYNGEEISARDWYDVKR